MLKHLFSRFFEEKWADYDNCTLYRLKVSNVFLVFGKEWEAFIFKLQLGDLSLELTLEESLYPRYDLGIEWPHYFSFKDCDPGIAIEDFHIRACLLGCGVSINFSINEDD